MNIRVIFSNFAKIELIGSGFKSKHVTFTVDWFQKMRKLRCDIIKF